MGKALDLIDNAIADLEARLNISPGANIPSKKQGGGKQNNNQKKQQQQQQKQKNKKQNQNNNNNNNKAGGGGAPNLDQPEICKLEFKVGQIVKVWNHPEAEKLYCEEIDIGEETGPRQIASGLRPHFTLDEMMGQRLLVITNLKPRNLVKFKSHGMVLCAAITNDDDDGKEKVEFIEPPMDAKIGEIITFDGLSKPQPLSASQVDKKKVFINCLDGMKTTDTGLAAWNGHIFTTSAGPCKAKTITNGVMR